MMGRRKFIGSTEAVAAAVAVVILVGVVVAVSVAATIIFKRVTSGPSEPVAPVHFASDPAAGRIVVTSSSESASWGRLAIRLESMSSGGFGLCVGNAQDATPTRFYDEAAGTTCTSGPNRMTVAGNELVRLDQGISRVLANSYVQLCGEGQVYDATIKILDMAATTTVATLRISNVQACHA